MDQPTQARVRRLVQALEGGDDLERAIALELIAQSEALRRAIDDAMERADSDAEAGASASAGPYARSLPSGADGALTIGDQLLELEGRAALSEQERHFIIEQLASASCLDREHACLVAASAAVAQTEEFIAPLIASLIDEDRYVRAAALLALCRLGASIPEDATADLKQGRYTRLLLHPEKD